MNNDELVLRRKYGNKINPDLVLQVSLSDNEIYVLIDKKDVHGFSRVKLSWFLFEKIIKDAPELKEKLLLFYEYCNSA